VLLDVEKSKPQVKVYGKEMPEEGGSKFTCQKEKATAVVICRHECVVMAGM